MTPCPRCGTELGGLATYCYLCKEYVADMGERDRSEAPASSHAVVPDDRSEDEIRWAIRQALELLDFVVLDFEQSRKGTRVVKGLPDLLVMWKPRGFAWAEIKTATGKVRDEQAAFRATMASLGIPCFLWRHESEAIAWAQDIKRIAA